MSGHLLKTWRAHDGASIWCLDDSVVTSTTEGVEQHVLLTAGGDGSVKKWSLSDVFVAVSTSSEPLLCEDSKKDFDHCQSSSVPSYSQDSVGSFPWLDVSEVRSKNKCRKPGSKIHQTKHTSDALLGQTHLEKYQLFDAPEYLKTTNHATKNLVVYTQNSNVSKSHTDKDTSHINPEHDIVDAESQRRDNVYPPSSVSCEKATFVRCLALASSRECVVGLDSGDLWLWRLPQLVDDAERNISQLKSDANTSATIPEWLMLVSAAEELKGYSIVAACPSTGSVAVCGLRGHIFVLERAADGSLALACCQLLQHGKVFSATWLSNTLLLLCFPKGLMAIYRWASCSPAAGSVELLSTHELPSSKQRWFTSACLLHPTRRSRVPQEQEGQEAEAHQCWASSGLALLVGDRSGSLHVYWKKDHASVWTERGVHGSGGVVSVSPQARHDRSPVCGCHGNELIGCVAVTTGRDGWVRHWKCEHWRAGGGDGRLVLSRVLASRHSGVGSWVARCLSWHNDTLVAAFHDVYLEVWSAACSAQVARVQCGGGHRAWDMALTCSGGSISPGTASDAIDGAAAPDSLVCVFLKDGLPRHARVSLHRDVWPVKTGLSAKATLCGAVLLASPLAGSVLVLAGEDNVLRFQHFSPQGRMRQLAVVNSHISAVRTLAVIQPCGSEYVKTVCVEGALSGTFKKSDGGKDHTKKELRDTDVEKVNADSEKDSCSDVNDMSETRHLLRSVAKDTERDADVWLISGGGRAQMKIWKTNKANLETCLLQQGCDSDDSFLECVEVLNHQLLEDRPTSWKQPQDELSAETRHMACCGIWLSTSTALVALASSDARIRIFSLKKTMDVEGLAPRPAAALESVCEASSSNCFLCLHVQTLQQSRMKGQSTSSTVVILRATDTVGRVIYWTLVMGLDGQGQSENSPRMRLVSKSDLHQSGINSITSRQCTFDECARLHPNTEEEGDLLQSELLLTGGDDNRIVLSDVSFRLPCIDRDAVPDVPSASAVVEDVAAAGVPALSALEIFVSPLREVVGHSSQITGLEWLSPDRFLSISIDQRLMVWSLRWGQKESESSSSSEEAHLVLDESVFSGVADIHGMLVWNRSSHGTSEWPSRANNQQKCKYGIRDVSLVSTATSASQHDGNVPSFPSTDTKNGLTRVGTSSDVQVVVFGNGCEVWGCNAIFNKS